MNPGRLRHLGSRALLALLPAGLLGAYADSPLLFFLNYFALTPWVILYTDDRNPQVSFGWFVAGAWVANLALYPQTFLFGWQFPLVWATVYTPPWLIFVPLMRRVHRRWRLPRTLSFPLVWVTVEGARLAFGLAHFDLYGLGYSQARLTPLIQISDVTGFYGVSFLVAALNGWLADAYFAFRDRRRDPAEAAMTGRRLIVPAVALVVAVGAVWTYGLARVPRRGGFRPGPRLAVVQPNLRHNVSDSVGVYLSQLLMTDERVGPDEADLIVWPENAILDNLRRPGAYLDDLAWLARKKSSWLVVGAMGKPADHPGRTSNTAFLVDPDGNVAGQYDKQILFPWSEYVPIDGFLGRFSKSVQRLHRVLIRRGWGFLSSGVPGDGMVLLRFPWQGQELPFAVLICVENAYPPVPSSAGRLGARFFVNITSEGEVGGPVQEQLLRVCMFRAAENRIPYVRAGNTGISGFIDPAGRLQSLLVGDRGGTIFDAGVLIDRAALASTGPTVYARSHDAFLKSCVLATLVLAFWPRRRARRRTAVSAGVPALWLALGLLPLPWLTACGGAPALGEDADGAKRALARGREQLDQGRPGEALASFAAACAEPLACRQALAPAARCFLQTQQPELGGEFFATVAERHPEIAGEALGHRGDMLEQALDLLQAVESYERALEAGPTARVWGRLGSIRLRLEDRGGAIIAFREGLRLAPDDLHLRYLLGRALRIGEQWEEARAVFEEVLKDDPGHSDAWTNLGRALVALGETAAGERAFRQAITIDPTSVEARFRLFKLVVRDGRRSEARRLLAEIRAVEASLGRGHRGES